jgi:hypothetical protein
VQDSSGFVTHRIKLDRRVARSQGYNVELEAVTLYPTWPGALDWPWRIFSKKCELQPEGGNLAEMYLRNRIANSSNSRTV